MLEVRQSGATGRNGNQRMTQNGNNENKTARD